MTALFAAVLALGVVLCIVAVVWWIRARRARRIWRHSQRDTARAAIVLELADRVHEIELREHDTAPDVVDVR